MRRATGGTSGLLELFVERQAFYRLADARRLVHVSEERLRHAIDEGVVEPVSDGTSLLIPWEDVASLALTRWTPRQIAHIVRRAGHPEALPPLNQFRTIQVELPVYQIRLLHYLAEQRSLPGVPPLAVSDVLEYELGALAAEEGLTALDRAIPGFAAAAHYPLPEDRPQLTAGRCVYCDAGVAMNREVCRACVARHVPVEEGAE
ncbi:MAG TPA: hypothetical protein VF432_01715 [Thermoanaerobaculia bacterium]